MQNKINHRPLAALFDWDGTLHAGFTIFPWCQFLSEHTVFPISLVRHLNQLFTSYKASEITHDDLAIKSADAYAEGTSNIGSGLLEKIAEKFVASPGGQLYPFAHRVLGRLKAAGIRNVVISGAPLEVLRAYINKIPLDDVWGLDVQSNRESKPIKNLGLACEKAEIVKNYQQKFLIYFGFGDSIADLPLLEAATVAVLMNGITSSFPKELRHRLIQCTADDVEAVVVEQNVRLQTVP